MDQATISQVRRFNRVVTQRAGALNDRFLARNRLGEARLLGDRGSRPRRAVVGCGLSLGPDSGYVSRVLRSLEAAGLVVASAPRIRISGFLDRSAHSLRAIRTSSARPARWRIGRNPFSRRLGRNQRARMVAAMADVERLLSAALVQVASVDPADPRAVVYCLNAYLAELDRRFDKGFRPARSLSADDHASCDLPAGLFFLLVSLGADPIGCGAPQVSRERRRRAEAHVGRGALRVDRSRSS